MASKVTDKLTYLLAKKAIDFSADTFKCALMASGFVFNEVTQAAWADVSASELAAGNGYTAGGAILAGVAVTQDDTNLRTNITWNNVSWTAAVGNIGPTPGAIIYDTTVTLPVNNPIICYIDFGGNQTQLAGGTGTIANPAVRIGKA